MSRISTTLKPLDDVLKGGLVNGRQVAMYGPPKVGKTLLCLQIASNLSIEEDAPVLYYDTEGDFPDEETLNIYTDFLGNRFGGEPEIELKFIPDIEELMSEFGKDLEFQEEGKNKQEITLEEYQKPKTCKAYQEVERLGAKAVVLDSFSGPIEERFVSQSQNYPVRASVIKSLAGVLKVLAESLGIPIIETVHQTKNPAQPWLQAKAIGGDSYGYAVKTRLLIKQGKGNTRKILPTRHPGVHEDDFQEITAEIEKDFGFTTS